MCNEQLFRSVQHVFLFYVLKESTVQPGNTRLWQLLSSVPVNTLKMSGTCCLVFTGASLTRNWFLKVFFSPASAVMCCEVLQPLLLHYPFSP